MTDTITLIVTSVTLLGAGISAYIRLGVIDARLSLVEKSVDDDVKPAIKSLDNKIDKTSHNLTRRIDEVHAILIELRTGQQKLTAKNQPD